ncbi:hypothetical protein ACFU9K_47090, partial [Streptomyces sp. NPDC057582]
MWRVGRALALTFAAAVLVAGGIFYGLVVLLDFNRAWSWSSIKVGEVIRRVVAGGAAPQGADQR